MEARQKLAQPLSARCCSPLQLHVLNGDPQPNSISLEALLIDRTDRAAKSLSL